MSVRVLQICPFDIPAEPASGGQIRIEAIAQAYRAAGCQVDRCCIVTRARDVRRPLDLRLSWIDRIRRKHLGKPGHLGQIRQHWATQGAVRLQHQLSEKLTSRYQIVQIEHPWNFKLIDDIRRHPMLDGARVVYSAHNIEHELFRSVTTEQGQWNSAARRLAAEIEAIETAAAAGADLVWAVSEQDAERLRSSARQVLVVPNGCRTLPTQPKPSKFDTIRGRYALFVGTNFGPNVNGFLSMIGDDLSMLPQGTSMHTIGTCADVLSLHRPHAPWLHDGTLVHHGRVGADELDSALLNAGVILLPILSGGGTNLKSAEALLSGRPVLATSMAFRGFEPWLTAPGVHVADRQDDFLRALNRILSTPQDALGTTDIRHELTWPRILAPAVQAALQH